MAAGERVDGILEDAAECAGCGGECCLIYRDADDPRFTAGSGGGRNPFVDFDEHVLGWYLNFQDSGAVVDPAGAPVGWWGMWEPAPGTPEPLFDPFRLFIGERSERGPYRASLPAWVDTERCQYCHPRTGCLLPRRLRPPACLEYACERISASPVIKGGGEQ